VKDREIAPEFAGRWHKSTRSSNAASCVEVAEVHGAIGIRDSKNVTGPVLVFSPSAFAALRAVFTDRDGSRSSGGPVS
jgi:hypothetical protein